MKNFTPNLIIEEVKNLITYSISNFKAENSNFESLHKAIVKKYFDAKNVIINYDLQTIDMEIPVANQNYTKITFECQELDRFLQSCIKCDEKSIYFYQNLLNHYNVVSAA